MTAIESNNFTKLGIIGWDHGWVGRGTHYQVVPDMHAVLLLATRGHELWLNPRPADLHLSPKLPQVKVSLNSWILTYSVVPLVGLGNIRKLLIIGSL